MLIFFLVYLKVILKLFLFFFKIKLFGLLDMVEIFDVSVLVLLNWFVVENIFVGVVELLEFGVEFLVWLLLEGKVR